MAKRRMKKSAKKGGKKSAMKAMRRRKAKKVSKVGRKWQVFKGTKVKTQGGLKKGDLMKNRYGKIVSRKQSAVMLQEKDWQMDSCCYVCSQTVGYSWIPSCWR